MGFAPAGVLERRGDRSRELPASGSEFLGVDRGPGPAVAVSELTGAGGLLVVDPDEAEPADVGETGSSAQSQLAGAVAVSFVDAISESLGAAAWVAASAFVRSSVWIAASRASV